MFLNEKLKSIMTVEEQASVVTLYYLVEFQLPTFLNLNTKFLLHNLLLSGIHRTSLKEFFADYVVQKAG